MPSPTPSLALTADQQAALLSLPRYYTGKDLILLVFQGSEDAFIRAYCAGAIPPEVWSVCEATCSNEYLCRLLLKQVVQMLGGLNLLGATPKEWKA